jgi:mRNA-degrading endonuclease HigB of HigAB toxin-antitoxin module
MHLARAKVIEPNREVCIISNRHQRILNTVIFYFMFIFIRVVMCAKLEDVP